MQGVRLLAANQDFVSSTTAITIFILPLMPGQRLREVEPHLLFQSSLSDILQQPWMLCSFHLTLPIFHDIHLQILMLGQNFKPQSNCHCVFLMLPIFSALYKWFCQEILPILYPHNTRFMQET